MARTCLTDEQEDGPDDVRRDVGVRLDRVIPEARDDLREKVRDGLVGTPRQITSQAYAAGMREILSESLSTNTSFTIEDDS